MRLLRSFGWLLGGPLLDMIYISSSIWVWGICSPILLSISVSLPGACVVTTSPKLQQKNKNRLKREKCALTWLPSFCQKTAGCGFPFVSHGKLAVRPCATIWSRGLITNCGAAESRTKDMNITPYPQTHKCTRHTHTRWSLSVSGKRQASTGIDCRGHWDRASMHQPISDSIRPLGLSVCFDHKQKGQQQQPQEAIHPGEPADGRTEWMTGSFQARQCCGHNTRGKGGSFWSGHTERRSYVRTPHRERSFVSGFKYSTLFTLRTQSSFYFCIEDKQSSQAGQAWKTSNWLLAF